ncbi:MAG: leucyl aminopeptidase family protein [Patescibacteria group bacterium]
MKSIKTKFQAILPKDLSTTLIELREQKTTDVLLKPSGQRVIQIGVEDFKKINRRKLILLFRRVIALARANRAKKISINLADFAFAHLALASNDLAELAATNFEMANFEFIKYKSKPPEGWNFVEEIYLQGAESRDSRSGFERGQIIGEEVNKTRALANMPGGEMTPKLLAHAAREAVRGTKVKAKILGKSEIKKLGMGGIIGVSQGSNEDPQFVVLEYWGSPSAGSGRSKPIVLIGKGVTFDTGGLNLKPSAYIYEMHMDMSGGAAVIHAVALAAHLGLKINVVGLVPAAENMPSGSSYHPGDLLKSMSGKTIEVLDTDAEGRIILADALTYAQKFYSPRLVIDVATLTGSAAGALGERASAIFTPDENLEKLFRELGEESGDYVWPLPLWEEYEEEIKGTFGDWANVGKTRYGGAITAAVFLWQFIKESKIPWVHIDMAPRMTSIEGEFLSKGAAGAPVRLLIKLLEKYV